MGDEAETPIAEAVRLIKEQGTALEEFKQRYDQRLNTIEARGNRPDLASKQEQKKAPDTWIDTKSRTRVNVLRSGDALADLEQKSSIQTTVGRTLRGIVLGNHANDAGELAEERKALGISADTAGGFTVQGAFASQWIDLLRSRMVLNQAGAITVPMDSNSLSIARLTRDPTVSWHGENAVITGSEPAFGLVTLTARTAVCLVKMSLELAQDSANIEQMLQGAITSAMAGAIDSAGLVGVTTDAGAAPSTGTGLFDLTGRNTVTAIGAPTNWDFALDGMYELVADNVPMEAIGAMVGHPLLWKKMSKLKTGITGDQTSLTMPAEVARIPKLWTTAAPLAGGNTAKAVIGKWDDLLFGVRKNITIRVLQESFMGSNLQIGVLAYARCDFGVTRPASFCTLEGITVA